MARGQSVQCKFISISARAAIRLSDWARRSALAMLLIGVLIAIDCACGAQASFTSKGGPVSTFERNSG